MKIILILMSLFAALNTNSFAHHAGVLGETKDFHGEREVLQRIDYELHAMQRLIKEAKQRQNIGSRVKFDYPGLVSDLDTMRSGIRQYLRKPNREPRKITPMRGDYIR